MKKSSWIVWGIILLVVVVLPLGYYFYYESKPGKLDAFATCLKDKGVKFYGAFWCPHCQAQKALFSKSVKLLPYIECSNPDGQSQNQTCNDAGITGYPTWEFAGGTSTRVNGEMSLADLADKSGCTLPQ